MWLQWVWFCVGFVAFECSLPPSQVSILFSDRGIPDGHRHMNGYGSHTFKLVNKDGNAVYCKFHFKVCVYTCIHIHMEKHANTHTHKHSYMYVCIYRLTKASRTCQSMLLKRHLPLIQTTASVIYMKPSKKETM